jgi:OOP family OmpA-OmpF porin
MGVGFSQWYLGHIAIHQELRARLKREKDLRMKKLIFALIAGTAAMTAAQAQTTITPRPYIGIGASGVDREYNVQGATMRDNDGYRFGGKIFGGAELTENLGVEAGYTKFGTADASYVRNGVNVNTENKGYGAYVAGKATKHFNDKASVYAKLGVAHTSNEVNSATADLNRKVSDNAGYGALGMQYKVSEQVSLLAEYERYGTKKDFGPKPDVFTIGAKYQF